MAWLLDTCTWIHHLKHPGGPVQTHLEDHAPTEIFLCSVVKGELWMGAQRYGRRDLRLQALQSVFQQFVSLPYDDVAAWEYSDIRHDLEKRGCVIGSSDLKIAAVARAAGLTVVTNNLREFTRVSDLRCEDWTV